MIDEGYIKYRMHWTPTATLTHDKIDDLCRWRTRLHDVRLIGQYPDSGIGYGNLSARIGGSRQFLISGTQTGGPNRSEASQFSLVTNVDIEANEVTCEGPLQASSEAMTHASIYAAEPAVQAVVHVHDAELWNAALNRKPTIAEDVAYGTPAMARAFANLVAEPDFKACGIAAMAGHDEGLVAVGGSIGEAAQRILEFRSEVYRKQADR